MNWESAEAQRIRQQVAAIDLEIVALKWESTNTLDDNAISRGQ
jgi:hypothetical protein